MANPLRSLFGGGLARANETVAGMSVTDWSKLFRPGAQIVYNGQATQSFSLVGGGGNAGAYSANGVVFACESKRVNVFSEARFAYQQLRNGRPADLFSTPDLNIFEKPWPGGSTRDLLVTCELDVALYGNSYWIRDTSTPEEWLVRLDPNCMRILKSAVVDPISGYVIGLQLLGYGYVDPKDRQRITYLEPTQVAHYKPIPNPADQFLGMSWISPVLPDVEADFKMTTHVVSALNAGGGLGYVVTFPAEYGAEQVDEFIETYQRNHTDAGTAGKPLFLGGGVDVKTVSQSFVDLALKAQQGAGETRIAAAAGTPPVIVSLSEGMQGSSLNAGNYNAAKRNFVDGTMRPAWGAFAGAFASIVPEQGGARLWYDDRDIPFLRDDILDQAEILAKDAATIRTLSDAGADWDAVVKAVSARNLSSLVGQHSGLFSVQLQAPTTGTPPAADPASSPANGA